MAVTKLWSVTERLGQVIDYATNPEKTSANIKREFSPEQYQALADVIAYAKDEEKTEREFYVEGINCRSQNFYAPYTLWREYPASVPAAHLLKWQTLHLQQRPSL